MNKNKKQNLNKVEKEDIKANVNTESSEKSELKSTEEVTTVNTKKNKTVSEDKGTKTILEPRKEIKEKNKSTKKVNTLKDSKIKLETLDDVSNYLKLPGITIREKLNTLKTDAPIAIKSLVSKLLSYNEQVGPSAPDRGLQFITSKNYDLYNTLKQVVEIKDQKEFRVKMDIVNLVFLEYSKEAFMDIRLVRGDFYWKWGKKSLETYINLVTIISNLANLETRDRVAKNLISIDKATDIENTTLSETAIDNIRKYYNA